MGKSSKPRITKKRADKYEDKLAINGTLDQVLKIAVKSAKITKKK